MRSPTTRFGLKLGVLTAAIAVTAVTTNASILSDVRVIPLAPWGTDTSNEGRAISPDGLYVVGVSGTVNGYFYDVVNNVVRQPNGGGAIPNTPVTGIGYRTDPVTGQKELVLDGMSSGYQANWMTTDGGLTWGAKRRNTAFTPNVQSVANTLGSAVGSDPFYQVIRPSSGSLYVNQGSGTWTATVAPTFTTSSKGISSDSGAMNGVSATGRAVGYRSSSGIRQNYVLDWNGTATPTPWNFPGLAGDNEGQAFSVSADGLTIFGQSPVTVGGTTFYGYKATFLGNTELTINQLPNFADTAGSVSLAVPYGASADGRYAVGMDYRGMEKAVLWDTSDPNPANWTVLDLTDYATALGILDGWTRLSRAYSVGVDPGSGDPIVTGIGVYGGVVRAFVMEVPEPTTLALAGLGICILAALRRRK